MYHSCTILGILEKRYLAAFHGFKEVELLFYVYFYLFTHFLALGMQDDCLVSSLPLDTGKYNAKLILAGGNLRRLT